MESLQGNFLIATPKMPDPRFNQQVVYLFALGYSGWASGQLEAELAEDCWLVLPGDYQVIFNTPDQRKWRQAALLGGIDITIFGDVVGSA